MVTKELACHGAKVYLAARNKAKAQAAIKKLYLDNPIIEDGSLAWLPLDLADLDNVKNAAETLMKQEKRLDILGASKSRQHYARPMNSQFLSQ